MACGREISEPGLPAPKSTHLPERKSRREERQRSLYVRQLCHSENDDQDRPESTMRILAAACASSRREPAAERIKIKPGHSRGIEQRRRKA